MVKKSESNKNKLKCLKWFKNKNMRILINIALIAGLSFLTHLFIPVWWLFAVVAFAISFAFSKTAVSSFFSGFLAIFGLWLILILVGSINNDFILVTKMNQLIGLPHFTLLFLITAFIGGLLAGFSSLSGYFLKTFNDAKPKNEVEFVHEVVDAENEKNEETKDINSESNNLIDESANGLA